MAATGVEYRRGWCYVAITLLAAVWSGLVFLVGGVPKSRPVVFIYSYLKLNIN